MADCNSLTGATAPSPPHGGRPAVDLAEIQKTVQIESSLIAMRGLNRLAAWVSGARDFIDGIETGRHASPEFAEQLQRRDFSSRRVDWDEEVADGLAVLHNEIALHLATLTKAARMEVPQ